MVTVSYPAASSNFLDEQAVIHTYSLWSTIKCHFRKKCYSYPIVYTDSLMSYVVEDGKERTPWGIAIGDYILSLKAPEEAMPINKADTYCQNIVFARRKASLPCLEQMRYIIKNAGRISKLLHELGGTPLHHNNYLTSSSMHEKKFSRLSIDFQREFRSIQEHLSPENPVHIRPVISIADFY